MVSLQDKIIPAIGLGTLGWVFGQSLSIPKVIRTYSCIAFASGCVAVAVHFSKIDLAYRTIVLYVGSICLATSISSNIRCAMIRARDREILFQFNGSFKKVGKITLPESKKQIFEVAYIKHLDSYDRVIRVVLNGYLYEASDVTFSPLVSCLVCRYSEKEVVERGGYANSRLLEERLVSYGFRLGKITITKEQGIEPPSLPCLLPAMIANQLREESKGLRLAWIQGSTQVTKDVILSWVQGSFTQVKNMKVGEIILPESKQRIFQVVHINYLGECYRVIWVVRNKCLYEAAYRTYPLSVRYIESQQSKADARHILFGYTASRFLEERLVLCGMRSGKLGPNSLTNQWIGLDCLSAWYSSYKKRSARGCNRDEATFN